MSKPLSLASKRLTVLSDRHTEQIKEAKKVNLSGNRLKELNPCFDDTLYLNLSDNEFSIFPTSLVNVGLLTELLMRENSLRQFVLEAHQLPALKTLDLGNNDLVKVEVADGHPALLTIKLDTNKLVELTIGVLPSLRKVDLRKNKFTVCPKIEFVEELVLRGNKLSAIRAETLPSNVVRLDLGNNRLGSLGDLSPLGDLRHLDVSHNTLQSLEGFQWPPSLQTFNCARNSLSAFSSSVPPQLTVLNMSANKLREIPACVLQLCCSTLSELYVENNELHCLPEFPQQNMSLTRVDIKGNNLTYREAQSLLRKELSPEHSLDLIGFYDTVPQEVEPHLFLGGAEAARNFKVLKKLNVTHVLNIARSLGRHRTHPDFEYLVLSLEDTPESDIYAEFTRCHTFIAGVLERKGNVLIHCLEGISRSVCVLASYLMMRDGLTADAALKKIQSARPRAHPIPHFIRALSRYEQVLKERRGDDRASYPNLDEWLTFKAKPY